jgi:hypothetical protein
MRIPQCGWLFGSRGGAMPHTARGLRPRLQVTTDADYKFFYLQDCMGCSTEYRLRKHNRRFYLMAITQS